MRQTARIISTYSADVFGVCSALFELGGMTVMHDASGCNSTYTTHDEPRWYDMDSMVYISALTEMEAIMGDDEKLINDIAEAAEDTNPAFIAVAGTPIPAMTGFDYESVASLIEQRTGIPTFGFATTGMNTYVYGASMAFVGYAKRFVDRNVEKTEHLSVNILGVTPLDFSVNGTDESIQKFLEDAGFEVISKWAMGSTPEELAMAGKARVNLVVSATGLGVAKVLKEMFGTPYVIGVPYGMKAAEKLAGELRAAAGADVDGGNVAAGTSVAGGSVSNGAAAAGGSAVTGGGVIGSSAVDAATDEIVIVGEGFTSLALAQAIELEIGKGVKVLCATECDEEILREKDMMTMDEEEIEEAIVGAKIMIADPLYRPICPAEIKFVSFPAESFSGRIYRNEIPNLVTDFETWIHVIVNTL